jgi:hypothetical protein
MSAYLGKLKTVDGKLIYDKFYLPVVNCSREVLLDVKKQACNPEVYEINGDVEDWGTREEASKLFDEDFKDLDDKYSKGGKAAYKKWFLYSAYYNLKNLVKFIKKQGFEVTIDEDEHLIARRK